MKFEWVQLFALLLLMLVTGIFWGPWFSLHRSMKSFSKEEFIKIVKIMSGNLAVPMRIMMPCCILLVLASVLLFPHKESMEFYFAILSLLLIITSLIITIVVEVPIVKQIEQWTIQTIPSDMNSIQDRWLKFHVLRTLSAILSFICYVVSVL
jgi:uncharacterized membrane protein